MNTDIIEIKANNAWKTLITESPIYLLMSNKELKNVKTFYLRILYSNQRFLLMNYQKASQVSLLVELIKSSEIVSKEYSEARISEDLISNIKILCMKDSSLEEASIV